MGEAGLLRMPCPEDGRLDVRALCLARDILARHAGLADFAFAMQGLGTGPVTLFGTPSQRDQVLPGARAGTALAAFALSEPEAGSDVAALATIARKSDVEQVREEYHALFVGLAQGELLPYASYYMTGFLHEKPLANIRGAMAGFGIARAADRPEPEDHIASLCETMAGLIVGAFGEPASLDDQRQFFAAHIAPWAEKFFADLAAAKSARLYMPVGQIGRIFVEIEQTAFAMAETPEHAN
jgi:TorA maturation chaperone TorD